MFRIYSNVEKNFKEKYNSRHNYIHVDTLITTSIYRIKTWKKIYSYVIVDISGWAHRQFFSMYFSTFLKFPYYTHITL